MNGRNLCEYEYCDHQFEVFAIDGEGLPHRLCEGHAEQLGYNTISEPIFNAVRQGVHKDWVIDRKCDVESCSLLADTWLVWTLEDEDEEDPVVGCFCAEHASEIQDRDHGVIVDEDEAMDLLIQESLSWEDLWAALDDWCDAVWESELDSNSQFGIVES